MTIRIGNQFVGTLSQGSTAGSWKMIVPCFDILKHKDTCIHQSHFPKLFLKHFKIDLHPIVLSDHILLRELQLLTLYVVNLLTK